MRGPNRPYMCARFTLSEDRAFFPKMVVGADQIGTHPLYRGSIENQRRRSQNRPTGRTPQADRRSRFLALIWAMRMGPSENSPSPAFRVNSRK
jgi:hypothetical protein